MIPDAKLDFLIQKNYNVLFVGKHGVGKSSMVIDAFNRNNLKWMYFSASTMDPWVDFIGVPKEKEDPSTGQPYLDLVRPKAFQDDQVEALFFDEYNRSHKKVRNAVMELIQFKSINGKKFDKLKIVWAAINPDDEEGEYDVEKLDPAQKDRFHAILELPYKPYGPYFKGKYGADFANAAISWWHDLPSEVKAEVSPRRLDYALDFYKNNGDLKDVLPKQANVAKLVYEIGAGPIKGKLDGFFKSKDIGGAKQFLSNDNEFRLSMPAITGSTSWMEFFLPLLPEEKLSDLIATDKKVKGYVLGPKTYKPFIQYLKDIVDADTNKSLTKEIVNFCKRNRIYLNTGKGAPNPYSDFNNKYFRNTVERNKYYNDIVYSAAAIDLKTFDPSMLNDYISSLLLLVKESQVGTLKRAYPKLVGLLNTAFSVFTASQGASQKFPVPKGAVSKVQDKLKTIGGFKYLSNLK